MTVVSLAVAAAAAAAAAGPRRSGSAAVDIGSDALPLLASPALFDVRDYGAVGDGSHDDTAAVAACFAAASQAASTRPQGGVAVVVPEGPTGGAYTVRAPLVYNATDSVLRVDGTIRWAFGPDLAFLHTWPWDPKTGSGVPLITIGPVQGQTRLTNVTVTGTGTLDGMGYMWWPARYHVWEFCCPPTAAEERYPPFMSTIINIDGLVVSGLTFLNAPMITINGPAACTDAEMHDLNITAQWLPPDQFYSGSQVFASWRVTAPVSGGNASRVGRNGTCPGGLRFKQPGLGPPTGLCEPPNTDGIDPGLGSRRVHIHDVWIENGDDSVVIKPGWGENRPEDCTGDIVAERIRIFRGMGANIGGMGSGCVVNVTFRDISMLPSLGGAEIKTEQGTDPNSFVRGVLWERIRFNNSINATGFPCVHVHSDYQEHGHNFSGGHYPKISDVTFRDVDAAMCADPVTLRCDATQPCTNITFDNVNASGWSCANAECAATKVHPAAACCKGRDATALPFF